jgi:hypothetical protein
MEAESLINKHQRKHPEQPKNYVISLITWKDWATLMQLKNRPDFWEYFNKRFKR